MNLYLSGLPVTDSGLDALKDLPQLGGLHLSRTKIKGQGLGRLKSLAKLAVVDLDNTEITDEGLTPSRERSIFSFLQSVMLP